MVVFVRRGMAEYPATFASHTGTCFPCFRGLRSLYRGEGGGICSISDRTALIYPSHQDVVFTIMKYCLFQSQGLGSAEIIMLSLSLRPPSFESKRVLSFAGVYLFREKLRDDAAVSSGKESGQRQR